MKLFSGLVVWVAIAIAVLAVGLLVLDPASWPVALIAILFLPLAVFIMTTTARIRQRAGTTRGRAAVRASMVGGGALLISALASRIAETLGWIGDETQGRSLVSIVFVLVIVAGDFLAARMEKKDAD
ncbi:MAG: hypothetical protein NXI03_03855 [Alphaproteobacteria bacterium]|uniref:hypothetical protein n=1 Tax=Maricaulis alexandrii TaxID=2570354 RepID=UPI0011089189|nr:hypothetical protein [Maricaulis alexandrii]MCR9266682.1 hypothetical protein [Alphaproteobacteria bacterium]